MKFLNGQKPAQAQDAIISGAVVLVLISVTVFLFYCTGNKENPATQNTRSFSTIKEAMTNKPDVLQNISAETALEKPPLTDVSATEEKVRDFVYQMPEGISPPLPSLAPRPVTRQMNANIGEMITTSRNSRIIVPPNAFLDEKGNVIEGNVDIKFREFHDFRDIFLSGIPMHYDSGGTKDMLESAGMVELTASKDGKALYVNPAAKIKMMLSSAFKSKDYNLYYYDKQKNKWIYKGQDDVVMMNTSGVRTKNDKKIVLKKIEFRFTPPTYFVGMQCRSDMQDHRKYFFTKKKTPDVFDFRFVSCNGIGPDVKELRGVTWRYSGADARDVFMQIFRTDDTEGSDAATISFKGTASITFGKDSIYRLTVKQDSLALNIPVQPVLKTAAQKKSLDLKLERYARAVEKLKNAKQEAYALFQKDTASFYNSFGSKCFPDMSAETVALRTFEVSGFGIWNCDKRFTPPVANNVYACFTDEKGNNLRFRTAYMVDRNNNSVYTINDFAHFRFDPNSRNLCWAVLPGDKIAIIYPDEFDRHKKNKSGTCVFKAKISETALRSHSDLQAALNFN